MHECTAEKSSSISEGLVWRLEINSQALRAQSVWTEENLPCWNTVLTEPQYWAAKCVESPGGRHERWRHKEGTEYICYMCISTCMYVHTHNVKTSACSAHCLSRWEDTELNGEDSTHHSDPELRVPRGRKETLISNSPSLSSNKRFSHSSNKGHRKHFSSSQKINK